MPLLAVCCFSHLTDRSVHWEDEHYCVKKFKDALKEQSINRHAYVQVGPGPRRRLDQSNAADAFDWFAEMLLVELLERGIDNPVLVPFPGSGDDVTVPRSRTRGLADAVAKVYECTVLDCLRFDEPQPSASRDNGTRDPAEIYPHLRITQALIRQRPYVLVDDVITSGGHLRAAAALLRNSRADVVLAIGGVSADRSPSPTPFDRVYRELEDFTP